MKLIVLIKRILRKLFTPVILKMRVQENKPTDGNCTGTYRTYEEATLACAGFGYEQKDLISVIAEKTRRYKHSLSKAQFLEPSMHDIRLILAVALVHNTTQHNTTQHNTTQIIDFGGACGAHFLFVQAFFKDITRLQWHVIETRNMIEVARQFENEHLHFHDNLDTVQRNVGVGKVDLIYSSGALQYVPEPYETLKSIVEYGARYIFLTRFAVTTGTTELVTVQLSRISDNGIGKIPDGMKDGTAKYPVIFARKERVEEILSQNYEIKMFWKEHEAAYYWDGHTIDLYGLLAERRR